MTAENFKFVTNLLIVAGPDFAKDVIQRLQLAWLEAEEELKEAQHDYYNEQIKKQSFIEHILGID